MFRVYNRYIRNIGVVLLASFAFIGALGILTSASGNIHIDPVGYQCPQETVPCQFETHHSENWTNAFVANFSDSKFSLLFSILFVVSGTLVPRRRNINQNKMVRGPSFWEIPQNFLLRQFSDGILQPIR